MEMIQPAEEHEWLKKLVGEWSYVGVDASAVSSTAEEPPEPTSKGTETVRSLGGYWIVCEGKSDTSSMTTLLTLGYDGEKRKVIGTWVCSMMTHIWIYEGSLVMESSLLDLLSQGPAMSGVLGDMDSYREITEFKSNDHRVVASYVQQADQSWKKLMITNYYRKQQQS
jgi:Protein of unknown function (DUF1579)